LKPSLFELVAQEQLRDLLQPALKYILSVCVDYHNHGASPDRPIFVDFRTKIPKVLATDSQPTRGVLCINHALCRAALSS
jgi:hypothetical protein